ncbi:MAG TPA: TIM barrel protein, partial [Candidatus Limnocylindrales bacterium]|nr:TIM barrel protein [Candidatus Limnocylindrales bacterium]
MAVTVDGDARGRLRGDHDALPHASIGTVPILWYNTDGGGWVGSTILDEIARLGYEGTQLGHDFARGHTLRDELNGRKLRLAEVYAAIPSTVDGPVDGALDIARAGLRELHEARGDVLCVAIDGSTDRDVTGGRADGPGTSAFTDAAWAALADVLHTIADEAAALGHPTVFHPHAGTYVETPAEIERLLAATDADRVGMCLDTGHHIVGGADPLADLRRLGERVRHVHLKDVDEAVLSALRAGQYTGLDEAVRDGLFTELGAGMLDLDAALAILAGRDYDGWLMVEQDRSVG